VYIAILLTNTHRAHTLSQKNENGEK
jgi:hypothetical protein